MGQWFSNAVVDMDGYHFTRCRFDSCSLRSAGGDFQMTECYVSETNKVQVPLSAWRQLKLLVHRQRLLGKKLEDLPMLSVSAHTDGTISI